ncbi:MAG: MBL fold metallo-hydrolase [Gemmatimonadaceae bacterium]
MNISILGSGSRGNAVVVESDGARILIDAGFPARTLAARLATAGIPPESITALVLTHEHVDHISGACSAARRWGWKVYATAGTIAGTTGLSELRPIVIDTRETLTLDTMQVRCIRTPHDAAESIAVVVDAPSSGTRIGVAYDLGHVPAAIDTSMRQLDALILEANHDDEMLRAGPYPPSVQARIAGSHGHLSNTAAARLARTVAHRGLRHIVLAHLSENNNTPAVARQAIDTALRGSAFRGSLTVAGQDAVTQFAVERARRVEQLSLNLG